MAEKKNEKKSQVSLGVLFWIAFILLVVVVFLLNKPTITKLMRKFSSGVQRTETTVVQDVPKQIIPQEIPDEETEQPVVPAIEQDTKPILTQSTETTQSDVPADTKTETVKQEEPITTKKEEPITTKKEEPVAPQKEKPAETKSTETPAPKPVGRNATLYFVRIDASNGAIVRTKITRQLPKTDSPLVDTINALLQGPVGSENAHDTVSLIPEGTKLLSATVKNGTAVLNFNEAFQFGTYGIQGTIGQLMQIVFTATEFSTVKNVQFLIEGQRKDFLGADGIKIGVPFSRTSFN